ncbi:DivIVA domain-containing protein [Aquihabitans sp. G128]|uniref:DivIVA domain-containing protein n=1 Tax=Aquihabitans sp. G128 TaxID=2849779 RepID=UPI001C239B93|nr:DivIVA domain-containing protein [Aquihabitans sp. G128]QXC62600.1 DivIVA domain-containing protein [Aquihabitans sp. G128]
MGSRRITADDVRATTFRSVRRGYAHDPVDDLLDAAVAEIEAGRSPAHLVPASLPVAWRGYRPDEVDALLSRLLE